MTSPAATPALAADLALTANWMLHQRWYANKGALPILEEIGQWEVPALEEGVRLIVHLLLDHTPGKPALYQVPLSYRDVEHPRIASIGRSAHGWITDAPQDPAFCRALLAFLDTNGEVSGWRTWAIGATHDDDPGAAVLSTRVLSGEQSNTSFVVERSGAAPVIVKVFRAIHHGENPDVVLQGALSEAGSRAVPRSIGQVVAEWPDRGQPSGRARGHLVVAQEFLPGARDGWIVALEAARVGESFAADARRLGIVTAGVHATLAATMPTEPSDRDTIESTVSTMHERLLAAIDEVPALSTEATTIARLLDAAREARWPAQQRVHGDLHLGQVLEVPDRGWVLVDFEGEPLRPMTERSRLDSPLRDVAGMLRSFDYVVGSLLVTAGVDARPWAAAARAAFQEGYAEASGIDLREAAALLTALEIDKALYEAVYEARNRPTWLAIPVDAIIRLARAHRNT